MQYASLVRGDERPYPQLFYFLVTSLVVMNLQCLCVMWG